MGSPGPTFSSTSEARPHFPWSTCRVLRRGSRRFSPRPPGVACPRLGPVSPFRGLSRLGPAPAGIPWPPGVGRGWRVVVAGTGVLLQVLWLRETEVIYIFVYNFTCRYQNELKFEHKAYMIFLHTINHFLPHLHVYK